MGKELDHQMKIEYIVADPAGNTTGLVLSSISKDLHKAVAKHLLENSPHELEQVGFMSNCSDCDGRMDMMGGEFCGNASRSFGLYLAMTDRSKDKDKVRIKVSGSIEDLIVYTDLSSGTARIKMPPVQKEETLPVAGYGELPLVVMEGISHLIIPDHEMEKEKAEALLRGLGEELATDALGLMFYDTSRNFLTPLVWVNDTGTMYWESSCASGSAAVATFLKRGSDGPWQLAFQEPGGILEVEKDEFGNVYLGGPVGFSEVITHQIPEP